MMNTMVRWSVENPFLLSSFRKYSFYIYLSKHINFYIMYIIRHLFVLTSMTQRRVENTRVHF